MPTIVGVTAEATVSVLKGDISKREGWLNTESLGAQQNQGNTNKEENRASTVSLREGQTRVPVKQENRDQSQNIAVSCSGGVGACSAGALTPSILLPISSQTCNTIQCQYFLSSAHLSVSQLTLVLILHSS